MVSVAVPLVQLKPTGSLHWLAGNARAKNLRDLFTSKNLNLNKVTLCTSLAYIVSYIGTFMVHGSL